MYQIKLRTNCHIRILYFADFHFSPAKSLTNEKANIRFAFQSVKNALALSEVSEKFPARYSKYPAAAIIAALSPQYFTSG